MSKFYKSEASKHLNGREAIVPMGGMLGGGSSINFMMYTRAQGADFDSWNTEGWAAKDMIPLCNKLETYHPKGEATDPSKHGHVSLGVLLMVQWLTQISRTDQFRSVTVVLEARVNCNLQKLV